MPYKKKRNIRKKKTPRESCDKGDGKGTVTPGKRSQRICNSPTRLYRNIFKLPEHGSRKMPYQGYEQPTGLSPKEKSYIICHTRIGRYTKLKEWAAEAIKDNKIFSVFGGCSTIRKALIDRGWVEKLPPYKMNLTKIRYRTGHEKNNGLTELERLLLSNLIEKQNPNFIWYTNDDSVGTAVPIDMRKTNGKTLINRLKLDTMWTSKQGLCAALKLHHWFYIEDVAEVVSPRTYNSYDSGEIEGFLKDFKITACTSLLKWVLSMVANERHIFSADGKIPVNVLVFALNRCKEYLFRKQNRDIVKSLSNASNGQWNAFLKRYYRIMEGSDVFQLVENRKHLLYYLGYAKFMLKEIYKYRPQLSCEGCHDVWMLKPAFCSRGRGIKMASNLACILNVLNKANTKYVIQKYIEDPLLIHDTKFDIRQYYLVTSTFPLVIWMYQDCYLKFSSQKYNLQDFHESIHLTNNAVQKNYMNCSGRHNDLPSSNMWDSNTFKEYLNKSGKPNVWDKIIYPGMVKTITGIMLSCQDSLGVSKNRFELYGCDFILDRDYKPWLIEINSNPDLNPTTPVTAKICPAVINDIVKVVIDYAENSSSSTGRFECIIRQTLTIPNYGRAADLVVRGYHLPNEYFYRGNIIMKESFESTEIKIEHDLNGIISKLRIYEDNEIDIMKEPEDDDFDSDDISQENLHNNFQSTQSDAELGAASTAITGQLDELIDKITAVHNTEEKPFIPQEPGLTPSQSERKLHGNDYYFLYEKKSNARCISNTNCSVENLRNKKTVAPLHINNLKNELYEVEIPPEFKNRKVELARYQSQSRLIQENVAIYEPNYIQNENEATANVLEVAAKVVTFINEKEKEYFTNNMLSHM